MSTNTSEQGFSIQETLKSIDLMNDAVAASAAAALKSGAKLIETEQKRLISAKSGKLAGLIEAGKIKIRKKSGEIVIEIGYSTEAIKAGFEGLIMEFGRPGKARKGVMKYPLRNGKTQVRKIGRVEPTPHIRKGFDNKADEAAEMVLDELWQEVENAWTS